VQGKKKAAARGSPGGPTRLGLDKKASFKRDAIPNAGGREGTIGGKAGRKVVDHYHCQYRKGGKRANNQRRRKNG